MNRIESRFVMGPSTIFFVDVYVCAFQHGNFTGWGSERVKCLFTMGKVFLKSKGLQTVNCLSFERCTDCMGEKL